MTSTAVVSLHDVAPSTFVESRRLLSMVEQRSLIATLLVVPGPWGGDALATRSGEFDRWLRGAIARGHEIALHGWCHDDPHRRWRSRLLARGCAEFAVLTSEEARVRLERGLSALDDVGVRPIGFVPPGWIASSGSIDAVRSLGFAYTTSHLTVEDLWGARTIRIPALSQRPDSSLSGAGAAMVRRLAAHRISRSRDVRIAVHPRDVRDPLLLDVTTCLLDLATCARATTYASLVTAAAMTMPAIEAG